MRLLSSLGNDDVVVVVVVVDPTKAEAVDPTNAEAVDPSVTSIPSGFTVVEKPAAPGVVDETAVSSSWLCWESATAHASPIPNRLAKARDLRDAYSACRANNSEFR